MGGWGASDSHPFGLVIRYTFTVTVRMSGKPLFPPFERFLRNGHPDVAYIGCEDVYYDMKRVYKFETTDPDMCEVFTCFNDEFGDMSEYEPMAIKLTQTASVPTPLSITPKPVCVEPKKPVVVEQTAPKPLKLKPIIQEVPKDVHQPLVLNIQPKPQAPIHSPYIPGVVMKPTVQFEGITATEGEIKDLIPGISSIDADQLVQMLSRISCTNYERTIPDLGLEAQEMLAEIPELANTIVPKNGVVDKSLEALDDIKELIESIKIKKDSLLDKLFSKKVCAEETKKKISENTKSLRGYITNLETIINKTDDLMMKINQSKVGLTLHSSLIKVLKAKTKNSEKVLDSRFSSLYISLTIADQTQKLIELKTKNIRVIITVIRDTLLTSIPSWFNQLEILEQMEVSSAIDETLVQSLMNNQQEILKQLSVTKEKQ